MELRNLDNITKAVKTFADRARAGSNEEEAVLASYALADLDYLTTLAKTNFAACHHPLTANGSFFERFPQHAGGEQLVEEVIKWLYSAAKEKCPCDAPEYISCDYAIAVGDGGTDLCSCRDNCPFKKHTGKYV